jgi:hypothetical protein
VFSFIRLAGLAFAVVLVAVALRRLAKAGHASRVPGTFQVLVGVALAAVTVDPDLVTPLQDLLGLSASSPGRLLALLIVSVAVAYPLIFVSIGRSDQASRRTNELVRALAVAEATPPPFEFAGNEVLVCIPAYEEADNLPAVLGAIPAQVFGRPTRVLVIDDGSRDRTGAVAASHGCWVARHALRSGQGGAIQTAYTLAARSGAEIVITLDADGQHDPQELERLVAPIAEDRADFVLGSRRLGSGESQSQMREHGITILTRVMCLVGGMKLTDVSNGYRAIRANRLADLTLREDRFPNPELLFAVSRARLRILEVPITVRLRASGSSKKGGNFRYGFGFLKVLLRSWLG